MKNTLVAVVAVCLAVVPAFAESERLMFGGPTMGTTYHVRLVAESADVDVSGLQADIEALLAEIDRQMSTYRDDSELSRFNRAPADRWFAVSAATAKVVAAAQEISRKTDGALDVTVGPLLQLWHFGPDAATNVAAKADLPTDEMLKAARTHVGYEKLEVRLNPPALRKLTDRLEVDLSSIAPGYAVDRMAAILAEPGIDNFMVEIGGEVRTAGRRSDGKPWRVAIERPLVERREMQMALPLVDAAISTAGDYRKFFEHAGRRYSHIINPATGRPVEHSLASVTVVADTCIEADGWDTPLLVLGPERGFQCAKENGIAALFISRDKPREAARATPAWRERFEN